MANTEVLLELTTAETKAVREWLAFGIEGENSIPSVKAARRVLTKLDRAMRLDGIMSRCKPVAIAELAKGPNQAFKSPNMRTRRLSGPTPDPERGEK